MSLQPSEQAMLFLWNRGTENPTEPDLSHRISILLTKSVLLPARWSSAQGTICLKVLSDCKGPLEDQKGDLSACKKGRLGEQNVV